MRRSHRRRIVWFRREMLPVKGSLAFLVGLLLIVLVLGSHSCVFAAVEDEALSAIANADERITDCYGAVAEADKARANVSSLLTTLNTAGWFLSRARLAYGSGNFGSALNLATRSSDGLEGLVVEAEGLREKALELSRLDFMIGVVGSLVGGLVVLGCGVVLWFWLKRRYGVGKVGRYGLWFLTLIGVLALVVSSPGLSRLLVYPRTEFFTEFWYLDSDGKAENYPFNISSGQDYGVILEIVNRLGYCTYYSVEVKFRNRTQSAPDSFDRTPSSLQAVFVIPAFVEDEGVWEMPLSFSFDYSYNEPSETVEVERLSLDGLALNLSDHVVMQDPTTNRFFGDLFFELWIYNETAGEFEYHERFLSLKLNMTIS